MFQYLDVQLISADEGCKNVEDWQICCFMFQYRGGNARQSLRQGRQEARFCGVLVGSVSGMQRKKIIGPGRMVQFPTNLHNPSSGIFTGPESYFSNSLAQSTILALWRKCQKMLLGNPCIGFVWRRTAGRSWVAWRICVQAVYFMLDN